MIISSCYQHLRLNKGEKCNHLPGAAMCISPLTALASDLEDTGFIFAAQSSLKRAPVQGNQRVVKANNAGIFFIIAIDWSGHSSILPDRLCCTVAENGC